MEFTGIKNFWGNNLGKNVCVCVCVCMRERERERVIINYAEQSLTKLLR